MTNAALKRVRALVRRSERHSTKGEPPAAISCLETAVRILEAGSLASHAATVAALLNRIAACHRQRGQFMEAGQALQRAHFVLLDHGLERTSAAADTFAQYAALEHAAGNWLRGEPFARQAYTLRARLHGKDDPRIAPDLINLATLVERLGRLSAAARMYRRALRLLERAPLRSRWASAAAAAALNNLGATAFARGDFRQALDYYSRVRAIDATSDGADAAAGITVHNLAVVVRAMGRKHDARALLADAVAALGRHLGDAHPSLVHCLESYAAALPRTGVRGKAGRIAKRAARHRATIDTVSPDGVAATGTMNLQFACYRLSARPSAIHRIGVFAEEPIPARRKVIEYTGQRISQREAERRWNPTHSYLFDLNDRSQLDGAIGGSGAEYINHSCTPNLRSRILRDHILYFSDRAIRRGEELTVDYHYEADLDPIPCFCRTPGCRGTMNVLPSKTARKKS